MQTEIARHGPMIRRIGLSDCGLQRCQALRKYEVKGRVWKTVAPWMSYALRQGQRERKGRQRHAGAGL
jgi:hypothetical protein